MLVGIEASTAVAGRRTGVGHYAANLMQALRRVSGDDVEFVYFSNRYDPVVAHDGVAVQSGDIYSGDALSSRLLWLQLGLPRSIRFTRPDICHFPNHLLPVAVAGGPSVVTVHDMAVVRFAWSQPRKTVLVHRALLPMVRRSNCVVVTPSDSARQDVLACLKLPEERVRVVREGVSSAFTPHPAAEDAAVLATHGIRFPYVLSVGTLEPRKNHARLIDAFVSLVRQERLPHHLVLAGAMGWKSDDLRARLQRPEIAQRVHLLGYVPTDHLPALYRGAAAFAFPSHYEGFGLPVLEAMASGTPALTSTDPALRELTGDTALAADPYSIDGIADGLWQLLTDEPLHAQLRTRALARTRQFTWDRCALDTLAVYREAMAYARSAVSGGLWPKTHGSKLEATARPDRFRAS